ncbi:MAG: zinc ABC transporter substrate-binding protein [Phycisphaeraceae bacterium]|nr:zinc ABC transporter substrate-binding protein [Phycisphaeraceae bacterium]MCB9848833.1 zinc ABC transporter substrate-binding protein [Phycisphaeraceae bacterium]
MQATNTTSNRSRGRAALGFLAALLLSAPGARAAVRVVTSTPTFASIVERVGGDHVEVEALMKGRQDVHNVPPKPSFILKMKKADLFVHAGLDGEPWVPQLLKTSRNAAIMPGQPGNLDASQGITLLEVPQRGSLSRSEGDIHVYGNTHYLLDPLNGVIVARHVAEALKRLDPQHASEFDANADRFEEDVRALVARLESELAPYKGRSVIVYHRSWPYFRERFGLGKAGEVEPRPGISPGPQHLSEIVSAMERDDARVIVVEQYHPKQVADSVAERGGGVAVVLSTEVGGIDGADDYLSLFQTDVDDLVSAFREADAGAPANGHGG